jgi:hypothetical protein
MKYFEFEDRHEFIFDNLIEACDYGLMDMYGQVTEQAIADLRAWNGYRWVGQTFVVREKHNALLFKLKYGNRNTTTVQEQSEYEDDSILEEYDERFYR